MRRRLRKVLFFLSFFALFLIFFNLPLSAQTDEDSLRDLDKKIQEYTRKIEELQGEQRTLGSAIAYLDNKVNLATAEIARTEQELKILREEITSLTGKIEVLDKSLTEVSEILGSRIEETYKRSLIDPVYFLFSSKGFSDILSRLEYLKIIQLHDRELLYQMQKSKMNYGMQKKLKEEKQAKEEALKKQLVSQKVVLDQQKQAKEQLLEVTRNDEQNYQQLLAEARQEIASLLASKFVGKKHVSEGETIGLMGNTGFSTGPHLHFGVYNLRESEANNFNYYNDENPFNYLVPRSVTFVENSCDDVSSQQAKNIGGGSWMWPMNEFYITQCYGHTPYSWMYKDNFHHGIDISTRGNLSVKAVREGEAYFYRGDSSMGNNVRVFHPDGKMTLYLHLQ